VQIAHPEVGPLGELGQQPNRQSEAADLVRYLRHSYLVIDHVVLGVDDVVKSRAFYEQALAPLGVRVVLDLPGYIGFGDGDKPWFFIATRAPSQLVHVAFSAQSRALVDAFHAAAVAAGGKDNGAPGPRPHYHPNYYGAFVYDPDGNNIEAVCHKNEG
jgi:catechol 2,3-dioxygenase-like lactoylglutathione lyase family enzyme